MRPKELLFFGASKIQRATQESAGGSALATDDGSENEGFGSRLFVGEPKRNCHFACYAYSRSFCMFIRGS